MAREMNLSEVFLDAAALYERIDRLITENIGDIVVRGARDIEGLVKAQTSLLQMQVAIIQATSSGDIDREVRELTSKEDIMKTINSLPTDSFG